MAFASDASMFVILTGSVGEGKTTQMASAITATDADGVALFAPCLMLVAEASTYGTAGRLLNNPAACVVWPVADCDEALDALSACFPDGGPLTVAEARRKEWEHRCKVADASKRPKPPAPEAIPPHIGNLTLRSTAVDTISTLYKGSAKQASQIAREEIASGANKRQKTARTTSNHGALNNSMDQGRYAAGRCQALIDRLNGITQHHRGVLVLVSCHTRPAEADVTIGTGDNAVTEKRVIGSSPDLGATKPITAGCSAPGWSATWADLAAKANVIWHCFAEYPDHSNYSADQAIARGAEHQTVFGVITSRGTYRGPGRVMWVKSQGNPGEPMEAFMNLPNIWSAAHPVTDPSHGIVPSADPNLGLILAQVVAATNSTRAPHAVAC
jgi:hypothetical protein